MRPHPRTHRSTHDIDAPWIAYHYWMPDWLCWAIGFAVVQTECAICGEKRQVWKRLWWARPAAAVAKRKARLEAHQHRRLAYQPLYWFWPMENHQAWRRWRSDQASHN